MYPRNMFFQMMEFERQMGTNAICSGCGNQIFANSDHGCFACGVSGHSIIIPAQINNEEEILFEMEYDFKEGKFNPSS